jgi:hypothetical protein
VEKDRNLHEELLTDEELKKKLASGEYSISPRSGRLRKRIRVKQKKPMYSRRRMKKTTRKLLWILLIIGFILTLIIIAPEININPKKNDTKYMRK